MSVPHVTVCVAKAIYTYAGKDDLPEWDSLPPTIQISYIEEAEAALVEVCKHIRDLSFSASLPKVEEFEMVIKGILYAVADTFDPLVD